MINNVNAPKIPQILSDKAHELYRKFKTFLMKVYSMIKYRNDVGDLKEEFWQSYTGFARKLKEVGYENECYAYMDICVMYYHLMDCPDELLAHKEFFADLYESFEDLLYTRINNPQDYEKKYDEYCISFRKPRNYFYTEVAILSHHYDGDVLYKIESNLFKVID